MSNVPFEIRREILLRLPTESLFRFKIVCKTWRDMIEDPSFIKAHTQNQLNLHTLLVRNSTGAPLFSFSLNSLNAINGPQMIAATPIKQLVRLGIPRIPDLSEVASCNGLILLSHTNDERNWVILNPLTRDCHVLPNPNTPRRRYGLCAFGIGYDDDADDYKVVKVIPFDYLGKEMSRTLIYSLKSDSWRAIADSPRWLTDRDHPGVFLNGTVYWKSTGNIVALHLNTDSYTKIPMPALKIRSRGVEYDENQHFGILFSLDALDGFLILSFHDESQRHFEGWVMEDEGWNKLYCMEPYEFSRVSWRSRLKPVAYLKDKRQIVLQDGCRFLMFNVDNNDSLMKFSIHGFSYINSSKICPGSLVRFRASLSDKKESTPIKKRMRKIKIRETRLTFCVRDVSMDCCSDNRLCSPESCLNCKREG